MNKNILIGAVVAIFLVIAIFQTVQIYSLKTGKSNTATGNVATGGAINMDGWTENEKMNYDMHGTIPARIQGTQPSSGSGMVGGC